MTGSAHPPNPRTRYIDQPTTRPTIAVRPVPHAGPRFHQLSDDVSDPHPGSKPSSPSQAYELEGVGDDAPSRPAAKPVPSWQSAPAPAPTAAANDDDDLGLEEVHVQDDASALRKQLFEESAKPKPAAATVTAVPSWQRVPGLEAPPVRPTNDGDEEISIRDMAGRGSDLWECPHCDAKNKPERTHCRSCGKSPMQPKDPPWWRQPEPILGAVIGVVLVVILLAVLLRTDLSIRPPTAASVDSAPRLGSTVVVKRDFSGSTFEAKGAISVCGRILTARQTPGVRGVVSVVLALGGDAKDPAFAGTKAILSDDGVQTSAGHAIILHLITSDPLDLTTGAYLSVAGDYGDAVNEGQYIKAMTAPRSYTVWPTQIRQ